MPMSIHYLFTFIICFFTCFISKEEGGKKRNNVIEVLEIFVRAILWMSLVQKLICCYKKLCRIIMHLSQIISSDPLPQFIFFSTLLHSKFLYLSFLDTLKIYLTSFDSFQCRQMIFQRVISMITRSYNSFLHAFII